MSNYLLYSIQKGTFWTSCNKIKIANILSLFSSISNPLFFLKFVYLLSTSYSPLFQLSLWFLLDLEFFDTDILCVVFKSLDELRERRPVFLVMWPTLEHHLVNRLRTFRGSCQPVTFFQISDDLKVGQKSAHVVTTWRIHLVSLIITLHFQLLCELILLWGEEELVS